MDTIEEIRRTIEGIAHQNDAKRTPFHFATVKSVGKDTCTVEAYGAEWSDVRLTASDGDSDFRMIPSVGSVVLVADLSNGLFSDLAVVMFSRVDKTEIRGAKVEIHDAKHTTANADTLRKELDKLSKRVDGIIDAIKNGVTTAYDGGAGLKATIVAALEMIVNKEDFSEIEDDSILH